MELKPLIYVPRERKPTEHIINVDVKGIVINGQIKIDDELLDLEEKQRVWNNECYIKGTRIKLINQNVKFNQQNDKNYFILGETQSVEGFIKIVNNIKYFEITKILERELKEKKNKSQVVNLNVFMDNYLLKNDDELLINDEE